ncbi:MAG: cytochrome P450 [Pigmentiphaga sp.]
MQDRDIDNAIASGKTYGDLDVQHAVFSRLRQEDPVHWTEPDGFRPFWTVTKNTDILEVERQGDLFINSPRSKLWSIEFEQSVAKLMAGSPHLVRGLPQMDGAEHRSYRKLTQAWFQPRQVKLLEPRLQALAKRTVDEMEARGDEFDFYNDVAVWFPLRVILLILGQPESDAERLLRITMAYFGGSDPEMQKGSDMLKATRDYIEYFDGVSEDRRRNPTDDVASIIANSLIDGQPIGHHEASSYYIALASAGHDSTAATAAGGVLAMIQNPEQWRKLKANPELLPLAIDEMVRWVSPVKHFFRTATQDYDLRGKSIKAGEALLMSYPSGNRDEDVFDDPFAFRVDRTPNKHVGFGFGAHGCLGVYLAKMELQYLFRELLARVDSFELAGEPAWVQTPFVGGLKRLPVRVRMHAMA